MAIKTATHVHVTIAAISPAACKYALTMNNYNSKVYSQLSSLDIMFTSDTGPGSVSVLEVVESVHPVFLNKFFYWQGSILLLRWLPVSIPPKM